MHDHQHEHVAPADDAGSPAHTLPGTDSNGQSESHHHAHGQEGDARPRRGKARALAAVSWNTRFKLAVVLSFAVLVGALIWNKTRQRGPAASKGDQARADKGDPSVNRSPVLAVGWPWASTSRAAKEGSAPAEAGGPPESKSEDKRASTTVAVEGNPDSAGDQGKPTTAGDSAIQAEQKESVQQARNEGNPPAVTPSASGEKPTEGDTQASDTPPLPDKAQGKSVGANTDKTEGEGGPPSLDGKSGSDFPKGDDSEGSKSKAIGMPSAPQDGTKEQPPIGTSDATTADRPKDSATPSPRTTEPLPAPAEEISNAARPGSIPPLNPTPSNTEPSAVVLTNTTGGAGFPIPKIGSEPTPSEPPAGVAALALATPDASRSRRANRPEPAGDDRLEPVVHVVRRGENFWTISRYYYGSGRFYKALWTANRDQVPTITDLYVGQSIRVPAPEDLDRSLIEPPASAPVQAQSAEARPKGGRSLLKLPTAKLEDPADSLPVGAEPNDDLPTHKVQRYETLRSIANHELKDSDRDDEIYRLNRDLIDDPYRLRVGIVLKLPADARRR